LVEGDVNGMRSDDKVSLGRRAESAAVRWLKKKGFKVLSRNFRCRIGEVDVIAMRGGVLYFVEVRSRRSCSMAFGEVAEAIDRRKLSKIARVGELFAMENGLSEFDRNILVIAVNWYNPIRAGIRAVIVDEF